MSSHSNPTDRDELLSKLEDTLGKTRRRWDSTTDDLRDIQEILSKIKEQHNNPDREGEVDFTKTLKDLTEEVEEANSAVEVANLKSEFSRAYTSPLTQVIKSTVLDIYSELGITIDDEDRFRNEIEFVAEEEPRRKEEIARETLRKVQLLDNSVREPLIRSIEQRDSPPADPEKVRELVNDLEETKKQFREIELTLETLDWYPTERTEISRDPQFFEHKNQMHSINEALSDVDRVYDRIPDGIGIAETLQNQLSENYTQFQQNPVDFLIEIKNELKSIVSHKPELSKIKEFDERSNPDLSDIQIITEFEDFLAEDYQNIGDLAERVQELSDSYNEFEKEIQSDWEDVQSSVKQYSEILNVNPPDRVADRLQESANIVEHDPVESYVVITRAKQWMEKNEEELLDELSPSARKIFRELSSGEEYTVSKDELDAVQEVMRLVDLAIKIDD